MDNLEKKPNENVENKSYVISENVKPLQRPEVKIVSVNNCNESYFASKSNASSEEVCSSKQEEVFKNSEKAFVKNDVLPLGAEIDKKSDNALSNAKTVDNNLNEIEKGTIPLKNRRTVADIFGVSETELEDEFNAYKVEKLLKRIDYLIDECVSNEKIKEIAADSRRLGFGSVTVLPVRINICQNLLQQSKPVVNTLLSYPYGGEQPEVVINAVKKLKKTAVKRVGVVMPLFALNEDGIRPYKKMFKKIEKMSKRFSISAVIDIEKTMPYHIAAIVKLCLESSVGYISLMINSDVEKCLSQIKTLSTLCSDKIKIIALGSIDAKNSVRLFTAGVDIISSRRATTIAEELEREIKTALPISARTK